MRYVFKLLKSLNNQYGTEVRKKTASMCIIYKGGVKPNTDNKIGHRLMSSSPHFSVVVYHQLLVFKCLRKTELHKYTIGD